ncbi:hypothetical protein H9P43_001710 [Blastocladiella emersonii ATCC 22665]|nr:hypothetical protein H9P43_001710 [Blastocladiella emersonii ATCC 22665]
MAKLARGIPPPSRCDTSASSRTAPGDDYAGSQPPSPTSSLSSSHPRSSSSLLHTATLVGLSLSLTACLALGIWNAVDLITDDPSRPDTTLPTNPPPSRGFLWLICALALAVPAVFYAWAVRSAVRRHGVQLQWFAGMHVAAWLIAVLVLVLNGVPPPDPIPPAVWWTGMAVAAAWSGVYWAYARSLLRHNGHGHRRRRRSAANGGGGGSKSDFGGLPV